MIIQNIFKQLFRYKSSIYNSTRKFCSNDKEYEKIKITICGAAGRIGQLLALFLKQQSSYDLNICLYDISPTVYDIDKELSIINTGSSIESYAGPMRLRQALKDSHIVAVLIKSYHHSKKPIQPETFEMNYPSVSTIAKTSIEVCPQAILAIATNPLNIIIPALCEIYKMNDMPYRQKIIGLTSLDVMIAGTIYSNANNLNPTDAFVPITGGTTANTIVPMFSQATPSSNQKYLNENTVQLMNNFLKYKTLESNMSLSSALAISRFIESLIKALNGEKDIVECAFVATDTNLPCRYLTSIIDLNENGILNVYGLPKNVNQFEKRLLNQCLHNLCQELSTFNNSSLTNQMKI